jgi:diacylglycerol kinase (ATP)
MPPFVSRSSRRVFVVLNPLSGGCTAEHVRRALDRYFACEAGACQVREIADHQEDVAALVRGAVRAGAELVVAAGGDGTASAVADGLIGSKVPLGILPLGTANVLARELSVPLDLEAACALLAGEHAAKAIDAMRVGNRHFFTQLGVGLDALMIRDTPREHKKRFGRVAYLGTALVNLVGLQPRRFRLSVDGQYSRPRASQVVIANCGLLGQPPFRWGPDIRPDDGRLDVCVIRARTFFDYARLFWNFLRGQHRRDPKVRYLAAERAIAITTDRPFPIQADGEIIGETPVQVEVVPGAVRVLVPASGGTEHRA